jgi:peptidoglycan/LPS O-acetylase OafA/YrhL
MTAITADNSPKQKATIHLPGLNGIRAIAALAVVFSHTTLSLADFGLNPYILGTAADGRPKSLNLAAFGVSIFFALSGFLITYLLLKEKETAPVNIKKFYIRRVLRIWPLYYTYLIFCIITLVVFGIAFNKQAIIFYVLLAANVPFILNTAIPFATHYWSLGVEEQFYAFWPWIVKKTNKKLLSTIFSLIILLVLLRIFFRVLEVKKGISLPFTIITVTRFHCMMIGAAGAVLYYKGNAGFIKVITHWLLQAIAWGIIVLLALNKFKAPSFIDNEIIALITVVLILGQITRKQKIINLENRVCDFIGKISYGVYVIHPLIIFYLSKLIGKHISNSVAGYILVYAVVTAVTLILAYLSYEYFEKRFLKIKQQYTVIKSAASRNE